MEVEQSYTSNKFDIVLCELFNTHLHGFNEDSDPTVHGHYLVIHTSKNNSIYINYNNENELLDSDADTDSVDDNDRDVPVVFRETIGTLFIFRLTNPVLSIKVANEVHPFALRVLSVGHTEVLRLVIFVHPDMIKVCREVYGAKFNDVSAVLFV